MSEQSITGKNGNNTVRDCTLVDQSGTFGDPWTSSTPDMHVHVCRGLHFVWTEPFWKQYIFEYKEKRKKPTDTMHASYIFSCKYNVVFKIESY